MHDADWRRKKGKLLKRRFNSLWEDARARNSGALPQGEMERIANLMRIEGRQLLDGEKLPANINASLVEAVDLLNPHKKTIYETIKLTLWICAISIVFILLIIPLGSVLNHGTIKAVAATWNGQSTGGIWGHIGAVAGVITLVFMMWKVSRKITPQQKAVQCQDLVVGAIRAWAENGGQGAETSPQLAEISQEQ